MLLKITSRTIEENDPFVNKRDQDLIDSFIQLDISGE
jgi:hypothetical protein